MRFFPQQTGPVPNQSMESWLRRTAVMEYLNIALFYALWVVLTLQGRSGPKSLVAVTLASLLLAQGGAYWWLKASGAIRRESSRTIRRTIIALIIMDAVALAAGGLVILAVPGRGFTDVALASVLYLLAIGEYVHYYFFKINMRASERAIMRENGVRPRARLRRELDRAQRSTAK